MSMTMTKAQAIATIEEHWTVITHGTRAQGVSFTPTRAFFDELWIVEEQLDKLPDDSVIERGD